MRFHSAPAVMSGRGLRGVVFVFLLYVFLFDGFSKTLKNDLTNSVGKTKQTIFYV